MPRKNTPKGVFFFGAAVVYNTVPNKVWNGDSNKEGVSGANGRKVSGGHFLPTRQRAQRGDRCDSTGTKSLTPCQEKNSFVFRTKEFFSMISVPHGTGDISSI